MNVYSPTQSSLRPKTSAPFFQPLSNQRVSTLSGNRTLWLSIGKTLLVLCPIFFAANLWLAASYRNFEQAAQAVKKVHHELIESQTNLKAKRDQLLSPERVRVIASEKLSLYVPQKEQIVIF